MILFTCRRHTCKLNYEAGSSDKRAFIGVRIHRNRPSIPSLFLCDTGHIVRYLLEKYRGDDSTANVGSEGGRPVQRDARNNTKRECFRCEPGFHLEAVRFDLIDITKNMRNS